MISDVGAGSGVTDSCYSVSPRRSHSSNGAGATFSSSTTGAGLGTFSRFFVAFLGTGDGDRLGPAFVSSSSLSYLISFCPTITTKGVELLTR